MSPKCLAITSVLIITLSSLLTNPPQGCLTMLGDIGDLTPDSQVAQPASSAPLSQSFSPSQRHEAGTHLWLVGPQLNFSAGHTCLAVETDTCAWLGQRGYSAWCQPVILPGSSHPA